VEDQFAGNYTLSAAGNIFGPIDETGVIYGWNISALSGTLTRESLCVWSSEWKDLPDSSSLDFIYITNIKAKSTIQLFSGYIWQLVVVSTFHYEITGGPSGDSEISGFMVKTSPLNTLVGAYEPGSWLDGPISIS